MCFVEEINKKLKEFRNIENLNIEILFFEILKFYFFLQIK